jgi:hypothetical protein
VPDLLCRRDQRQVGGRGFHLGTLFHHLVTFFHEAHHSLAWLRLGLRPEQREFAVLS